jgi:hypothetical protein
MADDLADLHSVVAIPPIGPAVFDDLVSLSERVGGGENPDLKKRLTKSLTAVSRMLASSLSSPVLTALLRAVREDPRYLPRPRRPAALSCRSTGIRRSGVSGRIGTGCCGNPGSAPFPRRSTVFSAEGTATLPAWCP